MRYENYSYLWMPRPDNAIPKGMLSYYEAQGWIAQIKMNGTANLMAISPDRKTVVAMTRHNEKHKAWNVNSHTIAPFQNLPGTGWYYFTAELMHSKGGGIRNINYIHDILVADGEYLIGSTFAERQTLLHSLFKIDTVNDTVSHHVIDEHTWMARNYSSKFFKLFESLDRHEYEGLVIKQPTAKLVACSRQSANNNWQLKTRKPTLNYGN